MLFSLSSFETQTCTIIVKPFVILFPLQPDVCDVYLLNHAILAVMLIYRGIEKRASFLLVLVGAARKKSLVRAKLLVG